MTTSPAEPPATAYCTKCKATREIAGARKETMGNGTPALRGACSVCETKVFRFIKRERA